MATLLHGIGTVNFEVYQSGLARRLGIASIELASVNHETVDMKGNGLLGTTTMPVLGNLESLELKLTWRVVESDTSNMYEHRRLDLSLYADAEHIDAGTGEMKSVQHRLEAGVVPKNWNLGKWEPSATADSEITFEVITLSYNIEGVEKLAFDKLNKIFRLNGDDKLASHRRALGLT